MFSGAFAHNLTQSQIENAAKDPVWLSLLKYPKGEHKSEIKDQSFFLSPYGSESPKDELIATIDAAATDRMVGNPKQEIVCAYPARVQFIEKKLGVKLPIRDCPKWNRFYSRFH